MGKMKMSSTNTSRTAAVESEDITVVPEIKEVVVPHYIEVEKLITVEVPKPVTKDVTVEIPKPNYKIVEVEEVVQKPKFKVDEVSQSVIKPVFTIKQETIVLDVLQKKVEETVQLASAELVKLRDSIILENVQIEQTKKELDELKQEFKLLKILVGVSAVTGILSALASILG